LRRYVELTEWEVKNSLGEVKVRSTADSAGTVKKVFSRVK